MKVTQKADWFTRYLYKKDFWVGGTPVMQGDSSWSSATQTIRFFNSSNFEFLIVYILEFNEPFAKQNDYESTMRYYLERLDVHPDFTLAIWPDVKPLFAILDQIHFSLGLETNDVLQQFEKHDPNLVGQASHLKPLNRSFNDFFHMWARKHMKGFQNDIDAFIKIEENIHMFELKRPKESVDTWRPYLADTSNYTQFSNMCKQKSFSLTNIAYSELEPGTLKIFKDVSHNLKKLNYVSANLRIRPEDDLLLAVSSLRLKPETSTR